MSESAPSAPSVPRPRRYRLLAVLVVLTGGLLGILSSTQPWFTVVLHESPDNAVTVAGADALPVLAPLSLAALALGAALSIAGRFLTYAVGLLTLAIGGVLLLLAVPIAFGTPASAVAAVVTEATGIAGETAVSDLIKTITSVGWGYAAVVGGAFVALAGALILTTAQRWQRTGRRYRTASDVGPRATLRSPDGGRPSDHVDAFDAWDGLSRGDDPTR